MSFFFINLIEIHYTIVRVIKLTERNKTCKKANRKIVRKATTVTAAAVCHSSDRITEYLFNLVLFLRTFESIRDGERMLNVWEKKN